jgi:hypothetical protein
MNVSVWHGQKVTKPHSKSGLVITKVDLGGKGYVFFNFLLIPFLNRRRLVFLGIGGDEVWLHGLWLRACANPREFYEACLVWWVGRGSGMDEWAVPALRRGSDSLVNQSSLLSSSPTRLCPQACHLALVFLLFWAWLIESLRFCPSALEVAWFMKALWGESAACPHLPYSN